MGLTSVFLPGMHGTGELFGEVIAAMPAGVGRRVVEYPRHRAMGYGALLALIEEEVRDLGEMVVVGESFSGALALRLGAKHPGRVKGVVMVAGFVGPSVPRVLCWMGAGLALVPVPLAGFWIRCFVSGFSAPAEVVRALRREVWGVKGHVMARRILAVSGLDAREALRGCQAAGVPVMYLAGGRDRLVGRRGVRRILRVMPEVRVRVMDAPHLVLQVRGREAWGEMEGWEEL